MLILLHPRNPQNIFKLSFSLDRNKSNLFSHCVPNICFACLAYYYTSYAQKSVDRGLKNAQFLGFLAILPPTTANLYLYICTCSN